MSKNLGLDIMWCSICGEWLAQEVAQSEARLLAVLLRRHQNPQVQRFGAFAAVVVIGVLIKRLFE